MCENKRAVEEIKAWLNNFIIDSNLKDAIINISNQSEAGGYTGDILFAEISGTSPDKKKKRINYVFKCSKQGEAFRQQAPITETFQNEITFFKKILPSFQRFQKSRGVKNVFNSVPMFYGSIIRPNMEILIFEDLNASGYELWDVKLPLTNDHLKVILKEYGKLHAISAAMQDQDFEEFQRLAGLTTDIFRKFADSTKLIESLEKNVQTCAKQLKGILEDDTLSKLSSFHAEIPSAYLKLRSTPKFKVIMHGDCWSNNFMHKYNLQNSNSPIRTAILDWQVTCLGSPILDISHFLLSCMNETAAKNVNSLLDVYYESFSQSLVQMKSDPNKLWSRDQFLKDWKQFARHGIPLAILTFQLAYCKKEDRPDLSAEAAKGNDVIEGFNPEIKEVDLYRSRSAYIVNYCVKNGLLD